jgi:hypothetical protein
LPCKLNGSVDCIGDMRNSLYARTTVFEGGAKSFSGNSSWPVGCSRDDYREFCASKGVNKFDWVMWSVRSHYQNWGFFVGEVVEKCFSCDRCSGRIMSPIYDNEGLSLHDLKPRGEFEPRKGFRNDIIV